MSGLFNVRMAGPLSPYAESFKAELARTGYTPLSAANQLRLFAHLSRWLDTAALEAGELTSVHVSTYLAARRGQGYTGWLSLRGLSPILDHLRALGVVPSAVPPARSGPVEELLDSYRAYLISERGLVASSVEQRETAARMFLTEVSGLTALDLEGLTASVVTGFVVRECTRLSVGTAKILVTGLRSLLRYLFLAGLTSTDLAPAVPAVAGWRGSSLPKALQAKQVEALLGSCDRRRAVGRRDFAILTLLARLGLRSGEVAGMELADIDWRRGDLVVRGKGRREERLPLPVDVGEAVTGYLCRGRPRSSSPKVFLGARAPREPLSPSGVGAVVRCACLRAGLAPVGAHRLRHTAATQLLAAGAPMSEIGQLLRHRSAETTAIYAKVDRLSLRALARAWPGGAA